MDADILKNFSDAINEIWSFLTDQSYGDELYYHSSCFYGTFFDTENYTAYLLYLKDHEAELFPMLQLMNLLNPYVAQHEEDAALFEKERSMYVKLKSCIQQFAFTFDLSFDPARDMMADYISQKQAPAPATQPAVTFAPAPAMSTPAYTEPIDRQRLASYEQQIAQLKREKDEKDDRIAELEKELEEKNRLINESPEQEESDVWDEKGKIKREGHSRVYVLLLKCLLEHSKVDFNNRGNASKAATLVNFITGLNSHLIEYLGYKDIDEKGHEKTVRAVNKILKDLGSEVNIKLKDQ